MDWNHNLCDVSFNTKSFFSKNTDNDIGSFEGSYLLMMVSFRKLIHNARLIETIIRYNFTTLVICTSLHLIIPSLSPKQEM